ncbi:MAG: hypothetical protein GX640_12610 [Fibrobacter sp.]|nr:hypothetical protein [Fibrobacter sp.]
MNCYNTPLNELSVHDKSLHAAHVFLRENGIDPDSKRLVVDIDRKTWQTVDEIVQGDLTSNLNAILPDGLSDDDIMIVLVKPLKKLESSTFFVIVDAINYVAIASIGNNDLPA